MQQLDMVEVEEVSGGLIVTAARLAATAVGAGAGGYIWGKIEQLLK